MTKPPQTDWKLVPLGSVVDQITGQTNPQFLKGATVALYSIPAFDIGSGPEICSADSIKSGKTPVPDGVVMISKLNPHTPRVWMPDDREVRPKLASTEFVILAPKSTINRRFLKYVCSSPSFSSFLAARRTGTTGSHQRVRPADILDAEIPLPSASVQEQIAKALAKLDDAINAARHLSDLLETETRFEFERLFIENDGSTVRLRELVDVNPSTPLDRTVEAPYVDMAALPTDRALIDSWIRRLPGSGAHFRNGDTLLARITPCLENGKTAFVEFLKDHEVAWGSTEFIVLRPLDPLPSEWAYCLARSPVFRDYVIRHMTGTSGRQRCSASSVQEFQIPKPSEAAINKFTELAQPRFKLVSSLGHQIRLLSSLRDTLLPELMDGRLDLIDVPAAAKGRPI